MTIHIDNKELEFIHLHSILQESGIVNCLPESLRKMTFHQMYTTPSKIKFLTIRIP